MLSDPTSISLGGSGGSARSLARVAVDGNSAQYRFQSSTEKVVMNIKHNRAGSQQSGGMVDRHYVQIVRTVFATASSKLRVYTASVSFTMTEGADTGDFEDVVASLAHFLSSTTVDKLIGWES
jgi:hypothetical protein